MEKLKRTTIRVRPETYKKVEKWAQIKRMSVAAVFDITLANLSDENLDRVLRW